MDKTISAHTNVVRGIEFAQEQIANNLETIKTAQKEIKHYQKEKKDLEEEKKLLESIIPADKLPKPEEIND